MTRKASVHRASALPGASFRLWAEASLYKDEQIGEVCANVKQQVQQTQRALVLCTNLSQFDPIWPDLSWLLCWLFLFFQPDQCLGCMSEVLDNALRSLGRSLSYGRFAPKSHGLQINCWKSRFNCFNMQTCLSVFEIQSFSCYPRHVNIHTSSLSRYFLFCCLRNRPVKAFVRG